MILPLVFQRRGNGTLVMGVRMRLSKNPVHAYTSTRDLYDDTDGDEWVWFEHASENKLYHRDTTASVPEWVEYTGSCIR